jgi:multiple sugar transport system ATP-binding protein
MEVKLVNLTKEFEQRGKGKKEQATNVVAVDHINVNIPSGKLIGLLGPSGCGKSTTLYMIAGLHKPTDGQIFFGEQDITTLAPEKRGIGLVFQNYALYPHMTVEQNIMFPLENQKVRKDIAKARAFEAAKLVQIEGLLNRKPNELSGGQQQRVAIARALVKAPNVLLLDEPLSNLDARLRLQTREEIKRIQRETGVTTIFVTHDQEEAMSISDFIVVMKLGVIQQMDEPQKVYDDPKNLFVAKFLGTPPINVYEGRIESGKVYLGEEVIKETKLPDQPLWIGIRPEGFVINNESGVLSANIQQIEVMGRDISIIAQNAACEKPTFRVIVDADNKFNPAGQIKFDIKSNKLFLFNKETEERLYEEEVA